MTSTMSRKNRFQNAKFVLCIDIGTTFTAASYCLLSGGFANNLKEPKFQEVNRWPKQTHPDAKIPSVIYYDGQGRPRLRGAEVEDEGSLMEAEKHKWKKAEWWKMLLRPDHFSLPYGFSTAKLPRRVTADGAFEDQLSYVFNNAKEFFCKAYPQGEELWGSLRETMILILTVPNGWGGYQQYRMREAAVKAGLILPNRKNYVRFVSEGEAAVHYCIDNTPKEFLKIDSTIIVCDIGGGGTTDLGVYRLKNITPVSLEEVGVSRCVLAGGVYVNQEIEQFIRDKLEGSKWGTEVYIRKAIQSFEKGLKRSFTGEDENHFLNLDGSSSSDESRGVVRGRLKITKETLVNVFEPSIKRILEVLIKAITTSTYPIDQIFIVGGFAESGYVYSRVKKCIKEAHNIPICKPDDVLSKAIAHGGLRWHLDSGVQIRVAKLHYGAETTVLYTADDAETLGRNKFQNALGEWRVRHSWKCIVPKHTRLRSEDEHREYFHLNFEDVTDLEVELELYAFRFTDPPTFFKDKDSKLVEGFIHLGTVKADLTKCYMSSKYSVSPKGKRYKSLQYEVCLYFGDTELKASLRWKENGRTVVGNATISYDV